MVSPFNLDLAASHQSIMVVNSDFFVCQPAQKAVTVPTYEDLVRIEVLSFHTPRPRFGEAGMVAANETAQWSEKGQV